MVYKGGFHSLKDELVMFGAGLPGVSLGGGEKGLGSDNYEEDRD